MVAVGIFPVAVIDVALRSITWVGVTVCDPTVAVSVTARTGEAVAVAVSVAGAVAVSVAEADGSVDRAVSVCATAV